MIQLFFTESMLLRGNDGNMAIAVDGYYNQMPDKLLDMDWGLH